MKNKILWISRRAPYDQVAHAGGQIHNYLLKKFKKKHNDDYYLISFVGEGSASLLDLDKYNIESDISIISTKKNISFFLKKIFSFLFFPTILLGFDSFWYIRRTFLAVLKYKRRYGSPDVVVLQWTEMVNQILWLKKIFPKAKFVSIEEDVSFLRKKRIIESSNVLMRALKRPFFVLFKMIELKSLNYSDVIVLNNEKDKMLVSKHIECADKLFICHPFFQKKMNVVRKYNSQDILFYGAMYRLDNYLSAIWFIENVFPKLSPLGFRFVVVGSKPHESLKKYDNGKNIIITGFVDDVTMYFENSLCLVAPLVLGAGIKIKVLEAMSCGLPVLTNEIGIEGINAKDNEEFFFCKGAMDYVEKVRKIASDFEIGRKMSLASIEFIKNNFDFEKDADMLYERIFNLNQK